tara:strand:+ start:1983 stop:4235 length:2253 start_codon:yes stop_codon:yes gene_type:complete
MNPNRWNRTCSSPTRNNSSIINAGKTDTERDIIYNKMTDICDNAFNNLSITDGTNEEIEEEYQNQCEYAPIQSDSRLDIKCIYSHSPLLCTGNNDPSLDFQCKDQYPYINKKETNINQCNIIKQCTGTVTVDGSDCSTNIYWLNSNKDENNCPVGCKYSKKIETDCEHIVKIKNCCEQETELCTGNIDEKKNITCDTNTWLKPNAYFLPKKCLGDGSDDETCWSIGKPHLSRMSHEKVQKICCTSETHIDSIDRNEFSFDYLLNNAYYYYNESKKERMKENQNNVSQNTETFNPNGNHNCPCIFTWNDRVDFENSERTHLIASGWSVDERYYEYPLNFNQEGCKNYNVDLQPICVNEDGDINDDAPDWCSKKSCWIDPNNCHGIKYEPSSLFHREGKSPSRYVSYETCNEENYLSDNIYYTQECNVEHGKTSKSCILLNKAFENLYLIKTKVNNLPIDVEHINHILLKWRNESGILDSDLLCKGNININDDYNCIHQDKIDHNLRFIKPKNNNCCNVVDMCFTNTNKNDNIVCPPFMEKKDEDSIGRTIEECCQLERKCKGNKDSKLDFNCPEPLISVKYPHTIAGSTKEQCCSHPNEVHIRSISDIQYETIHASINIEGDFLNVVGKDSSYERNTFELNFKKDISTIINSHDKIYIAPRNIHIKNIKDGSIIVDFKITPHETGISINKYFLERVLTKGITLPLINRKISDVGIYNIKAVVWYHSDHWPLWLWIVIVIVICFIIFRILFK